jgi:hypothetical protein
MQPFDAFAKPQHARAAKLKALDMIEVLSDLFIPRGSPWENGCIESFNAKLRDALLGGEIFYTLQEVKVVSESWRRHYNKVRPRFSLGYRPPAPEAVLWPATPSGPASPTAPAVAPRPVMH